MYYNLNSTKEIKYIVHEWFYWINSLCIIYSMYEI